MPEVISLEGVVCSGSQFQSLHGCLGRLLLEHNLVHTGLFFLTVIKIREDNLQRSLPLERWLPTFLTLLPFNTAPHVVETLNHNITVLLPHNCNSATAMNHTVSIQYATPQRVSTQGSRITPSTLE